MRPELKPLPSQVLRRLPATLRAAVEREYYALKAGIGELDTAIERMNHAVDEIVRLSHELPAGAAAAIDDREPDAPRERIH